VAPDPTQLTASSPSPVDYYLSNLVHHMLVSLISAMEAAG
jgi:hypothetical protein